ncbi:hypothetical protein [Natronorubrum halophilum]|uniref:hypothetical protein n=1 Tax=Natronorubrum halophilum TaxID=1702106 RepID=UPI000EF72E92|nr:hypothetical protein [Natronorubrum halophilum]
MDRRTYVAIVGTMASAGLAGCVGELGLGDDGENDDDTNTDESDDGENDDGNEPSEDVEHGAVLAVEAYMETGIEEDLEGMSEAMHTRHPFDPVEMAAEAEENEDVEFTLGTDGIDDYEVELADEGYETDEIYDIPYVEFWFQEVDLEDVLEGEDAALVTVETEVTEDGETVTEEETLVALTEDGEWRVFLTYEEPFEIPDGEPVDEPDPLEGLEFDADDEMVTVHIDQSTAVDEVIVYSASLETDASVYRGEDAESFLARSFSTEFDADGDEIVVTAITDGEELVVYRETYEP